jgi:hypothetical protein
MGISLYKDGQSIEKLSTAFRCFEKVSNALKNNPNLWYYMALTVIKLNRATLDLVQARDQQSKSDVFAESYGYQNSEKFEHELPVNKDALKRL